MAAEKDEKVDVGAGMSLAEILSDLMSLRVCDPAAALALVSARPSATSVTAKDEEVSADEEDGDLKRAKDLVQLHYAVKVKHQDGELSEGLEKARRALERAVRF